MSLSVFLLALGATARLTHLVTDDRILGWLRAAAMQRFGPDHPAVYWLYCPWCVSPYLAAAVFTTAAFYGGTTAFTITAAALTASWVIGTIADRTVQ